MSSSGALKRMLEKAGAPPSPTSSAINPPAEQSTSIHARQIYPLKGPAQVPPESCKPWAYADRGDFEFDHVDQLAASFTTEGQLQPAIVRPFKDPDPASPIKYEIIAGRARWRSAKQAGTKLDVVVRDLTDEQAFRVMVQENESRRDLSDYSKGKRFRMALSTGLYPSQAALAKSLNLSEATLNRLLATASLSDGILRAFSSPAAIGSALGAALKKAEESGLEQAIIRDARKIEKGEIRVADIPAVWNGEGKERRATPPVEQQTEAVSEPKTARAISRRYHSSKGVPLFVVKAREDRHPTIRFKVPVDDDFYEELKALVERKLKRRK